MATTRATRRARLTGDDGRCDGCRQPLNPATAHADYCPTCAASYLASLDQALAEAALPTTIDQLDALLAGGLALDEHPLAALIAADILSV